MGLSGGGKQSIIWLFLYKCIDFLGADQTVQEESKSILHEIYTWVLQTENWNHI